MRTSLDFPDPMFRHLKARAAMEGVSLRDLVLGLIERGMGVQAAPAGVAELPSVSLGAPMLLPTSQLSNADLYAALDAQDALGEPA